MGIIYVMPANLADMYIIGVIADLDSCFGVRFIRIVLCRWPACLSMIFYPLRLCYLKVYHGSLENV